MLIEDLEVLAEIFQARPQDSQELTTAPSDLIDEIDEPFVRDRLLAKAGSQSLTKQLESVKLSMIRREL